MSIQYCFYAKIGPNSLSTPNTIINLFSGRDGELSTWGRNVIWDHSDYNITSKGRDSFYIFLIQITGLARGI